MSELQKGAYVKVNGFRLFYRVFGNGNNVLLCLHGGPGVPHQYMLPLGKIGDDRFKVILYDQLGCGKSEKPKDISLFTVDNFVEEVEGIRRALNLGKINLLGSSWGGMLALSYALKYQRNLKKLVTTGGLSSVPECVAEMRRLTRLLPRDIQDTIHRHEALWAFWHPEYQKAVEVYYHNFLCRMPKWPDEVTESMNCLSPPVYFTMWGPNEFTATGNLKDWDITSKLNRIRIPTLVTGGRYDEISPRIARTIHNHIRGSELVIFEKSAHLPMWEEQDKYLMTVKEFIMR